MSGQSIRAVVGAMIVLGIIGAMALSTWFGTDSGVAGAPPVVTTTPAAEKKMPGGEEAYYAARRVCEGFLKAPSTAVFSTPKLNSKTGWESFGYYQWKVAGFVDADNELGTRLRNRWMAVVQYNTGKLDVVYMEFADQKVGEMPVLRVSPFAAQSNAVARATR